MPQRRLLIAFVLSLALHLALLLEPLWRLPMQGEAAVSPRLDARLLVPPAPPTPTTPPAPPPKPKAPRRPPPEHAILAQTPAPTPDPAVTAPPPEPERPQTPEPPKPDPTPPAPAPAPAAPGLPLSDILASADEGKLLFHVIYGRQGLILGRAIQTWKRDGERYTLASVTETVGLAALFRRIQITQVSEGRITGKGLVPEEFRATDADGDSGAAHFDWKARRVTIERGGDKRPYELHAGAQDILSFIYQLVLRRPEGKTTLHVATGKSYNSYELDDLGQEVLRVGDKETATRHYITIAPPGEQTTEVWLSPDLAWLPVKVRFIDRKGQVYELIAYNLDFGPVQRQEPPPNPFANKP